MLKHRKHQSFLCFHPTIRTRQTHLHHHHLHHHNNIINTLFQHTNTNDSISIRKKKSRSNIRKKRWLRDARGERVHAHHARHAKHACHEKVPLRTPQRTMQRAHGVGTACARRRRSAANVGRARTWISSARRVKVDMESAQHADADMQRAQRTANGRNSGHNGTRQAQTEASAHTPN
jgi:hypothetical protein